MRRLIAWGSLQLQRMDNFDLQVTPVELSYQSKTPIGLSCIIKRTTAQGGTSQRIELRPSSEFSGGRATFSQGATFAIGKETELKNTKISLNFFNRNDRSAFLIGSTDLQLAALPPHPYTLLELKLENCSDPAARIKLEVQRRDAHGMRSKREKPMEMGLLGTEGQLREAAELRNRPNPSIPTAYEISRRNYKQAEVGCHEEKKSQSRKQASNSSKKGSYLQQRAALSKTSKFITAKHEQRAGDSPAPRRQTPEPIRIGKHEPATKAPPPPTQKYAISKKGSSRGGHSYSSSIHTQPNITYQEHSELQPQRLKVQPYEGEGRSSSSSQRQVFKPLKEDNGQKYRSITEKFQKIHDQIQGSKLKKDLPPRDSNSEQQRSHQNPPQTQVKQGHPAAINSFACSSHSSNTHLQTPKPTEQPTKQPTSNNTSPLDRHFQNVKSGMKTKSPDGSPPSQKTVSFQTIPPADHQSTKEEDLINDREIEQEEMEGLKREIVATKNGLSAALRMAKERDGSISRLEEQLKQCRQQLHEKQGLLGRLSQEYELRFEEIFTLKQRVALFEAERQQQLEQSKLDQPLTSSATQGQLQSLRQQLAKAKKSVVQCESQLRFKQNQSRRLILQMDNLKREKRSLEQQVHALVSKDKNELTRQASLARIEQLNSSSLANHTKRENQALRAEVKLLQQKLESLNSVFQSLLSGDTGKSKIVPLPLPITKDNGQSQRRLRLLQEKCGLLQQQLKEKKNQLAQIINVIWKHEDGDIMNDVLGVIASEKSIN